MAGLGDYKMVKLYEYSLTVDANGNTIEAVALRHKTYAEVSAVSGSRGVEQSQVSLGETKQFKIRWKSNWSINSQWTIKYFGKEYTIQSIERIDEKRFNWLITARN